MGTKQYKIAEELNMIPSRLSRLKSGDLNAADVDEAMSLSNRLSTPMHIWFKGGDIQERTQAINRALES